MTINKYQEFCSEGLKPLCNDTVMYLGLAGETGEVLDLIKKSIRDGTPISRDDLMEELGDVMWYVSNIATMYKLNLEEILYLNVEKLERRYAQLYGK